MRLNYRERQTIKAISPDVTTMTIRINVTGEERSLIEDAAKQADSSVSGWAELALTDLARVEVAR